MMFCILIRQSYGKSETTGNESFRFLPVREKPFGEELAVGSRQLAVNHKKHFAQEAANCGKETEACDCDAVLQ